MVNNWGKSSTVRIILEIINIRNIQMWLPVVLKYFKIAAALMNKYHV